MREPALPARSGLSSDGDLERLLIEAEIRRVLVDYCHGVDRRDWELVRRCYHDDARDSHGAFIGSVDALIDWMREKHATVTSSMHVLSNITIQLAEDRRSARTESYCLSHREVAAAKDDAFLGDSQGAGPARRTVACRYIDDFAFEPEAGWRIKARSVAFEWVRREEAQSFVPLDAAWTASRRDRSDQFYQAI